MSDKYNELYEKLSKLQWLLGRHQMMSHAQHGPFADPTRGQGRVLAMLKIQPEISTRDLSYLLGIRVPSLNELLNKLEKGGYIERKPSESDKRVVINHLTDKGRETEQEEKDYGDIFDCLNEEEQIAFGTYLDRIIAALQEQVGSSQDEEDFAGWMQTARSRMSKEQLEKLMSMRGGFGHGHGSRGFGHDHRGPAPEHMPGGERFSEDYDGPVPEGRGSYGCGRGRKHPGPPHHRPERPQPPERPHHPEGEYEPED